MTDIAAAATGITVTASATRWGCAQPNRFAAVYQAAYGCPPHQTLLDNGA
ncbi:hypothetical protein AB0Q95_44625 [Streptomyces sp. NPDC059900]